MGLDISNKLLVVHSETDTGTLEALFEDHEESLYLGEILDELELEYASPWFDADPEDWNIGVEISSPTYEQLLDQESPWWDELNSAVDKLNKIFGEGDIRLDSFQHVY